MRDVLLLIPASNDSYPHINRQIIRRIQNVAPNVKVRDASSFLKAGLTDNAHERERLDKMLAAAEVIFAFGLFLPKDLLRRAPKLKWLQLMSAGADRLRDTEIWRAKVIVTGVSGIHAIAISEFVFSFMLAFAKGLNYCFEMKRHHEWQRYTPGPLRNRTVGIVGLGHIGREVARLSKSFGMRVLATRRSAKNEGKAAHVDLLLPPGRLQEMLSRSDYVVLTVPLTSETHHLIGQNEFKAMKKGSYLINVARGGLIDERRLIRALQDKMIAGAALDVTSVEPLPKDSPLWEMNNVILSPHVSGNMDDYMDRATEIFCDNLDRYINGKKLRNVIDRRKGY